MNNQNFFDSNSSAADQETSYQQLSYPVENEAYASAAFQGSDHQNPMKNVFHQSLPSPPPTPMGLKNIADVLDPQKNSYASQMNPNFLNYQHHMNGSLPSFSGMPRYGGYDADHITAAAAVAVAQSQPFYPQEPSINNMSMESLIAPDMRNYQDMMRGVPLISNGKMMSETISDGKVYKCMKPNCSKVYKNSNGLKYHMEKGSCELEYDSEQENTLPPPETGSVKLAHRPYICKVAGCGKKYKNLNGLKYHAKAAHVELDFKSQVKFHKSSHRRLSAME